MSLTSRAATAVAVLTAAAIPVWALTIRNISASNEPSGMSTGSIEKAAVTAGSSAEADCSGGCAVISTGGSRLVSEHDSVEAAAAGTPDAAGTEAPASPETSTATLIPQNPTDGAEIFPQEAAAPKDEAAPRHQSVKARRQVRKKGPAPGSLESLFGSGSLF
jgi:hypothetical protein